MFRRLSGTLLTFLLALSLAGPALAQHLYLDTNGDGVPTDADAIDPVDSTAIDIWIRTDVNRDGSPAVCAADPAMTLTLTSFEVILQIVGGTVSWSPLISRISTFGSEEDLSNSQEYYAARGGSAPLAPGAHRLASIVVHPGLGTPSMVVGTSSIYLGTAQTAFGSGCSGSQNDNTLRLGVDWFDADGLRYGGPSRPPVIGAVQDMSVTEGALVTQPIVATDPDGSLVSFRMASGPRFVGAATDRVVGAETLGRVIVAPRFEDAGVHACVVEAFDGIQGDRVPFTVTVEDRNRPPIVENLLISVARATTLLRRFRAVDLDGDPVQFSAVQLPEWALFQSNGDNSYTLFLAPPDTVTLGNHLIGLIATDGENPAKGIIRVFITQIGLGTTFGGGGERPVAIDGGPYEGVAGVPVTMDGGASHDPEGVPLAFGWTFGDGAFAMGARPTHTYAAGGTYRVILEASDGPSSTRDTTSATIVEALPARAIVPAGRLTLRLRTGKPSLCVQVEPVDGSYASEAVDPATIVLRSAGTGPIESVPALVAKAAPLSDRDGNGIREVTACFAKEDLQRLFQGVQGAGTVEASVEGSLAGGARFRAPLVLLVLSESRPVRAAVSPNPLNPDGWLTFDLRTPGPVRVRLFDLRGRLVRALLDGTTLDAGTQRLRVDGKDDRGAGLASGVYYYRIDTAEGVAGGKVTILK